MEPLRAEDPRRIGRYRLLARLGAGGMGRVFLGFSPAGRPMAVKVVYPELARDRAFISRFRQEVAAARRVSGAYTAPVVDAGDDEPPWLATTLVMGPSLTTRSSSRDRWRRSRCGGWPRAWPRRWPRCMPAAWCTGT